jgi:uncharacterized protein YbaR (Trm112 family)
MGIDKKLLEILCCPVTKVPVKVLPRAKLKLVNDLIREGEVRYVDGSPVRETLADALITENDTTIYRIDDDIPVMLEDKGITTLQFTHF